MQEPLTKSIIVPVQAWPTPQDYNEAVQMAQVSFADPLLCRATPEQNLLGLPKATSGAFASVYKMSEGARTFALRFFLRQIGEQRSRYEILSQFILSDDLPYTVPFEYVHNGVRVRANWYPLVKMEWVDGITLDEYVRRNIDDAEKLEDLAARVETMCADLRAVGVAHGDLQHGNMIVIAGGELRLVDYDGMFVPAMEGMHSAELGHRNYQHPRRSAQHFGPYLDNFSELVIVNSLRILARDPQLFRRLHGGDECLILRQHDFTHPLHSFTFYELENHPDPVVGKLARQIRWQLDAPVEEVLPPSGLPEQIPELTPVHKPSEEAVSPFTVPIRHSALAGDGDQSARQARDLALARSRELIEIRKIVVREFAGKNFPFRSAYLSRQFWRMLLRMSFHVYGLLLIAFTAALLIGVASESTSGFSPLMMVIFAVWALPLTYVIRRYKRYKRIEERASQSLPTRANVELREVSAAMFDRHTLAYELLLLDNKLSIKESTALGTDRRFLELYKLNSPVEDYVFTDPHDHSIVARVDLKKHRIDWLL